MDFGRIQMGRRANKRFNYRPMYYDADKEDLKERVNKAEMSASGKYKTSGFEKRIKHGFKNQAGNYTNQYNVVTSGGRVRLLFIIIVIGLTFYLTFYTRVFSVIFEAFYLDA